MRDNSLGNSTPAKERFAIGYGRATTPFGTVLAANTHKGVCYVSFIDENTNDHQEIAALFPNAKLVRMDHYFQELMHCAFAPCPKDCDKVKLHPLGTPFQNRVWRELVKIPFGTTRTYGQIARAIGEPGATRAVGTAIGKNPIAFLIPCHRVVRSDGNPGNFKWGAPLKQRILNWEKANLVPTT